MEIWDRWIAMSHDRLTGGRVLFWVAIVSAALLVSLLVATSVGAVRVPLFKLL